MKSVIKTSGLIPLLLAFGIPSAVLTAQPTINDLDISSEVARIAMTFRNAATETDLRDMVWLVNEAVPAEFVDYTLERSLLDGNSWSLTFPITADIYRLGYLAKDLETDKSEFVSLVVIEKLSDDLEGVSLGKDDPAYDAFDCSLDPTMCETEISANPIALMLMQQAACGAKPEVC